jgi:ATP-binding cassette subfamily B protein
MKAGVREILSQCGVAGVEPIVCAKSDLTRTGRFGEEWVVASHDRLLVLQINNGFSTASYDILLKDIRSVKMVSLVGYGILTITSLGKPLELIRYKQGQHERFSAVAKYLEDCIKHSNASQIPRSSGNNPLTSLMEEEDATSADCVSRIDILKRLLRYLKPFRLQVVLLALLILTASGVGLVTPYLTRPLVDRVLLPGATAGEAHGRLVVLTAICIGMLACQLVGLGISIAQGRVASRFTHQLANMLRVDVFQHLEFLGFCYFDKKEIGSLVSRLTQDTLELESALTASAQYLWGNILTVLGIAIVLVTLNWKLFLLAIFPLPLAFIVSQTTFRRMFTLWNRWWYSRGRLYALLTENLIGIRVVKAFAQECQAIERFKQRSDELATAGQTAEQTWMTLSPILTLITGMGALIVWFVGGRMVLSGQISLGTLMTFIAYLTMFFVQFQFANRVTEWLGRTLSAAERIFEILDSPADSIPSSKAAPLPRIEGRISFQNVWFGYDKNVPVLKGIDLEVAPGEMIGLVGHSGAGKTTLINLLCRFYDVNSGSLLIDGVDIHKISKRDLRSQIGVVLQDTFLFNTSIAHNIAYGRPHATPLEIMAAAKVANAHQFIVQKADGYDTLVGERGQSLSVGERQRLAIARAILHNPRILLLDEATSSVDAETEHLIQEALERLIAGRTTFSIAHRLSTLRQANRLIVLKQGVIAEVGTHDELLGKKGEFSRLVQIQQRVSTATIIQN